MKSLFKPFIVSSLQWEAKRILRKYKPHVVAVTGSVGKTSSKDAIYSVLANHIFVRKSEKSFNSEIGIPLTILGQPNAWYNPIGWIQNLIEGMLLILFKNHYPKWLVLEVGADRPGDIQKVAGWLSPDVVVVTRLPDVPVHVEFFDSPEAVIAEKSYLPRALKQGGTLILNADDENVMRFKSISREARIITYGFSDGVAVQASNVQTIYENGKPVGISCKIDSGGSSVPLRLHGTLGRQQIYSALAGVAVGLSQDINVIQAVEALSAHQTSPGRMRLIEGTKNTTIIDDSYNSSPAAAHEALSALKDVETTGKRIAVLGDMLELGTYSADEHRSLGKLIPESADVLITVGLRARYIAEGANKAGMKKKQIHSCEESGQAADMLLKVLEEGDVVLMKASQSIRLEKAVAKVMAHPERKGEILVRQDKAWQRR